MDDIGHAILRDRGFHLIPHSGTNLLEHSIAVRQIILDWGGDRQTAEAGLLHSIYGTVTNKLFELPKFSEYSLYSDLVGEEVNSTVFTYACFNRERLMYDIASFQDLNSCNLQPQFDLPGSMKEKFRYTEVERISILMLANTFDILRRGDTKLVGRPKEQFQVLCSTLSHSRLISLQLSQLKEIKDV